MKAKVSLVKSIQSYAGTLAALKVLEKELKPLVKKAQWPVIKVNFVSANHPLAATPVEAVQAVIDFLRRYSKAKILVVETATLGTTEEAWQNYGYYQLEKKKNVVLFDLAKDQGLAIALLDRQGREFNVPFSQTMANSDLLISLTRPKTHDSVVITLTAKNIAVGGIIKNRSHIHQGRMIHKNLLRILSKFPPHLAVLDGTLGMEGDGPTFGRPIKAGWASASLNWLAIDTLGTYLMGEGLKNVGYLYLAKQKKMGLTFPAGVKVIGEKPASLRRRFLPHPTYQQQIKWQEPEKPSQEIRRKLTNLIRGFF